MQALIEVILPVFLVIGFGYVAAWRGLFSDSAVDGVMRFAQNFAVPVLLFKSIASLDLAASFDLSLFGAFYIGAFTGFGICFAGARWWLRRPLPDCVAIGFAGLFSNSLLLGLPITERAFGPDALAGNYAIISMHSPLLYGFGITFMELVRSQGQGLSRSALSAQVIRAIFSNPLVLGISAGVVVNLSGIAQPEVMTAAVDMMARSALPAALFGLGGVLVRYKPEGDARAIAMVCLASLVAHPAVTWILGQHVFDLDVAQFRSAVLTAAMAPGANAYMFAHMYGAGRRVAASSVLIATALSILTIWGWLAILP